MSKKDKLKAQKERQLKLQKEAQALDALDAASPQESRAAKKLRRQAAAGRGAKETWYMIVLKLIMIVPFLYSGFFYGGVLAAGVFLGQIEPAPPAWVGWLTIAGAVLIAAAIVVEFFRRYVIAFVMTAVGTGLYLRAAQFMIDKIVYRLENYNVRAGLQGMDREYRLRHYPILGCLGVALIIMVIGLIRRWKEIRRRRKLEENAPVRSIVD